MNKKLERFSKTFILGKNSDGLSAIEPKTYARRFKNFMKSFLFR